MERGQETPSPPGAACLHFVCSHRLFQTAGPAPHRLLLSTPSVLPGAPWRDTAVRGGSATALREDEEQQGPRGKQSARDLTALCLPGLSLPGEPSCVLCFVFPSAVRSVSPSSREQRLPHTGKVTLLSPCLPEPKPVLPGGCQEIGSKQPDPGEPLLPRRPASRVVHATRLPSAPGDPLSQGLSGAASEGLG